MILPRFEFEAPSDLKQAIALMAQAGSNARVLAGGTDLLVKMKRGDLKPGLLVSLCKVDGLNSIENISNSDFHIGALTTMTQLEKHPKLKSALGGLSDGAAVVGGPIIRNRATVGGNIINARPCADTVGALITLGAKLHLESSKGSRKVELDGFITAPGKTELKPDEILTNIEISTQDGLGSAYLKITRRSAMEITIVGCAASVVLDDARKKIKDAKIVLASVGPIHLRAYGAEDVLKDRIITDAAFEDAAIAAKKAAKPIDDHRAPAFYRSEMVAVTTRRALRIAVERAQRRVS